MRILVWLSGWVDSAVTAYLLKKEGHDVTAGFMINYLDEQNPNCPTREDIKIAKQVAEYLEIPFFTFDYSFNNIGFNKDGAWNCILYVFRSFGC